MALLLVSFFAWVLTILAPCVLPLLPVILGASVEDSKDKWRPYIIIAALSVSIIIFSLLLKATTLFIWVDPIVWKLFSWVILILFWVITIFPNIWKNLSTKLGFMSKSNHSLGESSQKKWITWSILVGMSLWPVFSSCSPTYAVILAVILPVSFLTWLINLFAYVLWLWFVLLLIALLWQQFIKKMKWASSPNGIFKKILWIIILLVWIAIISWFDKKIETKILDSWYFDITQIEQQILDKVQIEEEISEQQLFRFWLETDTSKISIDFNWILSGWPGKDGIPSINNPKFVDIDEAKKEMDFLTDNSRWISVEVGWEAKFYPYEILVWHEIVNDTIWNKKVSVTFCPLCWSAVVYNREINWEEIEFWVSWLLFDSNLLMYDNKTESLWSQSLWESVVWSYLWTKLEYEKSNLMTLEEFKNNFPKWSVLSDDTWFSRSYWYVPYWDYDESDDLYFPVANVDFRFNKKELFYIVNDGDESIAFLLKDLREEWTWEIKIWSDIYKATYNKWIIDVKKGPEILNWYYEMWFSWVNHNVENKNVWSINEN